MAKMSVTDLRALLAAEKLNDLFSYKDGELYYRHRPNAAKEWNTRRAGKRAGALSGNGRLFISVPRVGRVNAHRVIWAMFNGYTADEIDHIDNNPMNNRIENLRPASRSENQANVPGWCESGLKGAYFDKRRRTWYSRIAPQGRNINLGTFPTPEMAHAAYVIAASQHFGEYARTNHKVGA